jgi:hypothetical protein
MPDRRSSKPTVRDLIDQQCKLAKDTAVERVTTALGVTGVLQARLQELNDRQIGQLCWDYVWDVLPIVSPAMVITMEATHRLYRSPGQASVGERRMNDPSYLPRCPKCGEPMMSYIGIDEPNFQRCTSLRCAYKKYLGSEPKKECF